MGLGSVLIAMLIFFFWGINTEYIQYDSILIQLMTTTTS